MKVNVSFAADVASDDGAAGLDPLHPLVNDAAAAAMKQQEHMVRNMVRPP
jgi:hypothetical protein